jgi:hypothetical protein
MIVSDEDDADVDDAVVQTYYQVLINCLFQTLFRLFRIVPVAWNKVFRLQVIDLHGFLFIIIIIVPLF